MSVDPHALFPCYAPLSGISAILHFVLPDLRSTLTYEPAELRFGTSGRRGRVVDLTQLEIYINALAEVRYLLARPPGEGGIAKGDEFYFAHDLRPSSVAFDPAAEGRGELLQAAMRAAADAGMIPVNLGAIPTPALSVWAFGRRRGGIMVTGSHIPFDLNGYKLNTSVGEILKEDEAPIGAAVRAVREQVYGEAAASSAFDSRGMLKCGHIPLPPSSGAARGAYLERYRDFFAGSSLDGRRILVYQHSAVGRDLLAELLRSFGADVVVCGRSESFVALDTEAIDDSLLAVIQRMADDAATPEAPLWAVVSTDGDSDRPLVLGVDNGAVRFFPGDLVGQVTAEYLGADAVVVPISCNDSIDRGSLAKVLEPRTKIGSPHVVAGMAAALAKGRKTVCGWEANGGFLLGSDLRRDERVLAALPTRDAFLPILATLFSAAAKNISLPELFSRLPRRFSRSGLLRNFARESGRRIVEAYTARGVADVSRVTAELESFFRPEDGFSAIAGLDYTDGVRISFGNGDVAHFRPSGNADEFRMYAVADTQRRANEIVAAGLAEPDGIVRAMERRLRS